MSIDSHDDHLLRLATAVVEGEAVDWERAPTSDHEARRKVHNLRMIQSISEAHREVRDDALAATSSFEGPRPGAYWGKLRLLRRLGAGAFGEVYRAWDPDLECEVALKLPASDAIASVDHGRRFLREARKLAKVRHEHVLRVLGAEVHDGRVGMWTELVEGRSLEELLVGSGRFSAHEATSIGIELCRALAAVHAAGILHRDLKTANVVREEGGRIVLLDFSAAADRMGDVDPATSSALLSGTPRYMAPEQFRGEPATVRSDLYSLGVVLYRLTTVSYPIEAETLKELAACHERRVVTPLRDRRPDLPGPFVRVVERLLATDPTRRFSSAGEAEHALEVTRSTLAGHEHDAAPRRRTLPWRWLAASFVILLASVAALVLSRGVFTAPLAVEAAFFATAPDLTTRPLDALALVGPQDTVHLELELSRDAHVYVLNEDQTGHQYVLFPLPGHDLSNPMSAGRRHALPGSKDGNPDGWKMSEAGDVETVVVIAAVQPIADVEDLIAGMPYAKRLDGREDERESDTLLRGLGDVQSRPGPGRPPEVLPGLLERLEPIAAADPDIWFESFYFRTSGTDETP